MPKERFDPALVDAAMQKHHTDRTESDWTQLRLALLDCVGKIITNRYRPANPIIAARLYDQKEDMVQDLLVRMTRDKNVFDISKSPPTYVPRCWGVLTMVCTAMVSNTVRHMTAQMRNAHLSTDLDEASEVSCNPLDIDAAILDINIRLSAIVDETGEVPPAVLARACLALSDLQQQKDAMDSQADDAIRVARTRK